MSTYGYGFGFLSHARPSNPIESASNVLGWWDASDASTVTLSGPLVTQLDDKSINANHLTGPGGVEPTYSLSAINGLNALRFTDDSLINFSVTGISMPGPASGFVVWTVCQYNILGAIPEQHGLWVLADQATSDSYNLYALGATHEASLFGSPASGPAPSTNPITTTAMTTGTTYVIRAELSSNSLHSIYLDGASMGTDTTTVSLSGVIDAIGFGQLVDGRQMDDGFICEVIMLSDPPTPQISDVDSYLASKWQ
jgi:hypothetical protein